MSMSGSLISYENQCDVGRNRQKRRVEIVQDAGVGATAAASAAVSSASSKRSSRNRRKIHLNCLWSVWYGLCMTGFQTYLAILCTKRFLGFMSLSWPVQPPLKIEMNAYLAFLAASVIALPFFLLAAVFKIGNLANDGFKLGRNLSTCTAEPPNAILGTNESQSVFRSLWQHGGPTAPFLHLTAAFCLLMPKLMMEAKLIQSGFLPRDSVWKTDLDFMMTHGDRLLVLNFMTSPPAYANSTFAPTVQPLTSTSVDAEELSLVTVERGPKDLVIASFADDSVLGFISPEFLNYAFALLVYAVRYPSVFWNTNKWFGTLFSFQLLGNGVQSLLSFAGVCVLYKVQVVGAAEALPLLKKTTFLGSPFLLDAYFTLALFVLSSVLVLSSSLVLYLYGYGRFNAFLNTERERKVIFLKGNNGSGGWGYFTHCAALSVLLALAVCHAPLLHDYTIVYRGSLDGAVLACVAAAILHLFLWVFIWLVLTVKQNWVFHLRVTVGKAAVRSARSVKLVTDVDLASCGKNGDDATAPLLIVGNGRTYTIGDASPKRAIYNVIQKAAAERKTKMNIQGNQNPTDDDTEIYWLRPKPRSPKSSPSDSDRLNWFNKKLTSSQKHKVTFDDSVARGDTRDGKNRTRVDVDSSTGMLCEDDGDYATLRMGPTTAKIRVEDNISEDNKLLEHALRDDNVTFARSNELQPDYEDPSPLLTPEPNDLPLPPPPPTQSNHSTVGVMQNAAANDKTLMTATPKCLRRADSGMPHEELTPRSGSISSGSQSGSGGSPPGVQNSESSSGVHSNASSRRATSVDDLTVHQEPRQPTWKSCSLQRNVLPPNPLGPQQTYVFGHNQEQVQQVQAASVPPVILENPCEDTVVIRRKSTRPLTADLSRRLEIKEEPFGRSTNMRMTSFTDEGSSATLPHFPTQPPPTNLIYPCNTMPSSSSMVPPPPPPVVPIQPLNLNTGYPRPHTTLPIHHNGIRLFPTPYATKKFHYGISAGMMTRLPKHNRDSANFSMASSGESDCHP